MKNKLIRTFAITGFFLGSLQGYAAQDLDPSQIEFDFKTMTITSAGIYNPKKDGQKSGTSAEITARQNGITNIEKYFEKSCENFDKNLFGLQKNWQSAFKSQGTEIYSDNILKVSLLAPYKTVVKTDAKVSNLKTANGENIVFLLPQKVPASAVKCGLVDVYLEEGGKPIAFVPVKSTSVLPENTKIINLLYSSSKNALTTASVEDTDILSKSNVTKNIGTVLPVIVFSANK